MAVKIGLVGTGTVGGGCLDILSNHKQDFLRHFGIDLELARVCSRDPQPAISRGLQDLFTDDYHDIINDPEIDIVIELIGGTGVAKDVIKEALSAGKQVVTANKAIMASAGEEIMNLAEEKGVEIAFEASVGGGIPIIDPLKHSLIANRIDSIMGIVNGTTNYMLSRMDEDGLDYDTALKEAQERGFAEADPTADVDGLDAAAKIAILASIAFNSRVTMDQVYTEGIRRISPVDLAMAHDSGYVVKLVAHARRTEKGIDVRVHPTMIPESHQLATVNGVFNAIFVRGNMLGDAMFYGSGAGKLPTASAVVADVVDAAKHLHRTVVTRWESNTLELVPNADAKRRFFVRIHGEESVLKSRVDEVFGQVEFVKADDVEGEFAVITGEMTEAEYAQKAEEMPEVVKMIRMAD